MNIKYYEYLKNNLRVHHEITMRMIDEGMRWEDLSSDLQKMYSELIRYFGEKEGLDVSFLPNVRAMAGD